MFCPHAFLASVLFWVHIVVCVLDQEVFEDTLKDLVEVTGPRNLPDVRHQDGVLDLGDGGHPLPLPQGRVGARRQAGIYDVGQGGGKLHHDLVPELVGQIHREGALCVLELLELLVHLVLLDLRGGERGEEGRQLLQVDGLVQIGDRGEVLSHSISTIFIATTFKGPYFELPLIHVINGSYPLTHFKKFAWISCF